MKKVREYLEETVTDMLFNSVLAFWEPPTPKRAFEEEMKDLLASVEKRLMAKMEEHDRFVDGE